MDNDLEAAERIVKCAEAVYKNSESPLRALSNYRAALIGGIKANLEAARADECLANQGLMQKEREEFMKSVEVSDEEIDGLAQDYLLEQSQLHSKCLNDIYEAGFRKACELRAIRWGLTESQVSSLLAARWPSDEEIKEARIKWATKIHEEQFPEGHDYAKSQIPLIGYVPWDAACEYLRTKLCGSNGGGAR